MNSFRSEYLKFIYNKWLLLTVLATIILVPLFVIFLHETPSYITENYALTQILESFYLGQAGIIITILFIGQEFNDSTLRSSLLANPIRWKFFFIKLIVILSISVLVWSLVTVCTIFVVYIFYSLLIPGFIYTIAVRIMLVSIGLILICFSLVLITRSIVVPMGISLSFLLGLGQMLLQFSDAFLYFPIISTMNSFFTTENQPYLPSTIGIAIQFLWGILLLSFSILLFRKRIVR
ncbi:ABC transporter permease [Streptococcus suis]|uniref:ABC transporter permease n=1 Tax=Streptococcus suis TaxID=1307 RepID=UPI0005CE83A9|nr:ABC transporter permease [Streptococcus suis]NRG89582.1 ABC transporter permease [Streptococcus suis]CZA63404.1 membrane protein [Streptococcus suis]